MILDKKGEVAPDEEKNMKTYTRTLLIIPMTIEAFSKGEGEGAALTVTLLKSRKANQ